MFKTHFTRKNFIAISLVFFYLLMVLFSAVALDGNNPFFVKNNPIQLLAASLFPLNDLEGRVVKGVPAGSLQAYFLIILFVIYILLCVSSIIYEVRLAKYYDEKPTSKKWLLTYGVTFLVCGALWIGISMVSQISDKPYPYYIGTSFIFLGEAIVIGLLLFLILGSIVLNACFLVVNLKNIDKPFKFFDGSKVEQKELEEEETEEARAKAQGQLAESFGESSNPTSVSGAVTSAGASSNGASISEDSSPLKEKERVFPGLCSIDYLNMAPNNDVFDDSLSLSEIATRFRNYLAKEEGLYYSLLSIREFISAFAASRLIILEGLSGTGKSSLARYFSEFIGEKSFFEAVQATWRDRTSILGYYNDFSRTYNETEFLKRLYEFGYKKEHVNIMVLDELNISRVEYYFADFLSILEYPEDEWKIKIMQFPYDFDAPLHLQDGILQIPNNTFFIGTANKDESTYTITDKVYDRAITLDFDDRNEPFEVSGESSPISLSFTRLESLFEEAIAKKNNQLTIDDYNTFKKLTDFTYDTFDLTFGNRILHQIQLFVPAFVATGGTKEEALDFMFAEKVISKLEGRFEDYILQGLLDLKALLKKTYGEGSFQETNRRIARLIKKL
ncbi:MAG TPA: hypothetical protein DCZ41_01170 [Firmicutes bacterium]|nr:hypothetical protein [Bacillota bacterium]